MTKSYPTNAERRDAHAASNCPVMTEAEVADLLHVHQLTLTIWRRKGKGPPYTDGESANVKLVRYLRTDVMAWLEAQRKLAPAESDGLNMMRHRAQAGTAERVEYDTASHGIKGISNADVADGVQAVRRASKGGRRGRN